LRSESVRSQGLSCTAPKYVQYSACVGNSGEPDTATLLLESANGNHPRVGVGVAPWGHAPAFRQAPSVGQAPAAAPPVRPGIRRRPSPQSPRERASDGSPRRKPGGCAHA
jgi:hypothetical protein